MNKQELINELAKYVKRYENATDDYSQGRYGAYKVSLKLAKRLNEQNITDKQAWDKVAEAYPESAQSLRNTLDNAVFGKTGEPQKHVMPKFFDKWAKQVLEKRNKFYAISLITRAGWGYGVDYELGESENPSTTRELLDWLVEDSLYLNKEKATEALLYGYEVEEEPKWKIINDQKYCLTSIEAGYGNSLHWAFDSTKKRPILFDNEETAMYTAYITGGIVEKVEV
ncbi:hypothetical protein [Enterococcus durans]|uniref:hypothetical protein n=1 Tax=Enterococcus durans TaxID=53345 RepID=UPI00356B1F85